MESSNVRDIAKAIKEPWAHPLTMLMSHEGQWAADPKDILQRIEEEWSWLQVPQQDLRGVEAFMRDLPHVPLPSEALEEEEIAMGVAGLKPNSAAGPDGWRVKET